MSSARIVFNRMCRTNNKLAAQSLFSHQIPAVSSVVSLRTTNQFSSLSHRSKFAVVDHGKAYEEELKGRHGKQLELAKLDGMGRDDPPFNPFLDEEEEESIDEEENEDEDEEEAEEDDDDDDGIDEDVKEFKRMYNNDGSLKWKKSEIATFRAGAPAGGMFAIIELAGSQHKVTEDDLLIVSKLRPVQEYKVGSVHTLKDIMLVGSTHLSLVGMPYVAGAEVDVIIEEITQDKKVVIFKKRRKKHSQRKNGFRRDVTFLRILRIRPPQGYAYHEHVKRIEPEPAS